MASTTTILGGGLSGLTAAYYLLRRFGRPVTLLESSTRLGGWVRTESHNDKGFIFEVGPHTIRPKGVSGANTLALIEDLKLRVEAIPSEHVAARNRMIYAKGQLCLLPNSLSGIFKKQPPFSKPLISALFHDLTAGRKVIKVGDESIFDFAQRRFGKEIAEYAIGPMICGICAGDAKKISVRFLMNDLFEKEQRWGGVTKGLVLSGLLDKKKRDPNAASIFAEPLPSLYEKSQRQKWSMYRVEGGLENLPRKLGAYLKEHQTDIQFSTECKKITFIDGGARMKIKDRNVFTRHIVAAVPSYKLAPCFKEHHPSFSALLSAIEYVDVAVINLQYNTKRLLKHKAFGFLVPPVEQIPILGVIFDSCCFDMHGNTVLTVMMGGKWFEENFGKSPSQKTLLDIALNHVNSILGIQQKPDLTRVNILQKCIPQYTVGHQRRVEDIRRYIKQYNFPLTVCGAAYDGVGINDVILSARNQVQQLSDDYDNKS